MKNRVAGHWPKLFVASFLLAALPDKPKAAEQSAFPKPEKLRLEVATAGSGTTSLPLYVASDAGYFTTRGLNVSVNTVGATLAVHGVISGAIDIYQGGTAAIAAADKK